MPNNYNKKDIQYKFIGISEITTQNKVGDKIGTLQVYYQNKKLTEMPVYLTEKINFSPLKYFSENIWIIIPIIIILIISSIKGEKYMQNFPSEKEKKKIKLISEYQKALSYLNVDLKKLNINQLETFSNEELESKITNAYQLIAMSKTNAYQLIAMSKNLTDEMYQKFVRGDYSPKIHDIVINTLLSDYPFDVELFKLCLTDNVEDLEIFDIYSKINSAKEVVKHLRDSNKPSYTMSLEQQREKSL